MTDNRFVSSTLPVLQEANSSPILGYEDSPVLTLEEAVEDLVSILPDVRNYAAIAKKKYHHSNLLTRDGSAAIYLYTVPGILFFESLNAALRSENRRVLEPWFAFLKLFIDALKELPAKKTIVWRGVRYDATLKFVDNDLYTWWGISSCSLNINSVEKYVGESGTLFHIETIDGKDISKFSAVPDEHEVALMPGSRVRALSQSFNFIDRLFIIVLQQINSQR